MLVWLRLALSVRYFSVTAAIRIPERVFNTGLFGLFGIRVNREGILFRFFGVDRFLLFAIRLVF
jgi:hypothetical protein